MKKINKITKILITNFILITAAIIALLPLYYMIRISFAPNKYFTSINLVKGFTLEHYYEVFLNSEFPRLMLNSLIAAVFSTVIVMFIGSLAGYALARFNFNKREDLLMFFLSTRMGPPVAFAIPIFLLLFQFDQIDKMPSLILVYVFMNLAYVIWMMQGYFSEVSTEFEEAGMLDGLNRLGVLFRIAFPLVTPGLFATSIFVFISTWNEFFYAFVLTRTDVKTWPTRMPGYAGNFQIAWGEIFAASVVAVLPVIILGILIRRFLAKSISFGATE